VDREVLRGYGLLTDRPLLVALNRSEDRAAEPMPEALATRIAELQAAGLTLSASVEADIAALDPEEQAELQWRLSPAIAAVVLGLLAIPLSHSAPREGRGGRALLGIMAYTVYVNILYMNRGWIASGVVPTVLGMWWVHLLVVAVALFWIHRQGRMVAGA